MRNCECCCGYFFSVFASHPIDECAYAAGMKICCCCCVVLLSSQIASKWKTFTNQIDAFKRKFAFDSIFCFWAVSFSPSSSDFIPIWLCLSQFFLFSFWFCSCQHKPCHKAKAQRILFRARRICHFLFMNSIQTICMFSIKDARNMGKTHTGCEREHDIERER